MSSEGVSLPPFFCDGCKKQFKPQGFTNHQKKCKKRIEQRERDQEYESNQLALEEAYRSRLRSPKRSRKRRRVEANAGPTFAGGLGVSLSIDQLAGRSESPQSPTLQVGPSTIAAGSAQLLSDVGSPGLPQSDNDDEQVLSPIAHSPLNVDDIRTEYHPSSGLPTRVDAFEDFDRTTTPSTAVYNLSPWLPFHSKAEFEFAEIALQTAMSNKQLDALINVVHTLMEGKEAFKIKNHRDVQTLWDRASESLTPFSMHEIHVPYKNISKQFEFWCRPLWDWLTNLLEDPHLVSCFEWDARQFSKFDGKTWQPFVNEPWTAKRFWTVQSQLPHGAKPLCITLYADKTRLSSFGTAQGYPIMAQCANLPREIRNGKGLGATQVVGWLPLVPNDEGEAGKPGYINFKRAVWHESFKVLLSSISTHSFTGCWVRCGDKIERHLFPFVFILSADYEEQSVMALIRGEKGLHPCPICLVPRDQQSNLSTSYALRTEAHTREIYEAGQTLTSAEREELFKSEGLRNVSNAFWTVQFSDPHAALSWDHMHNYAHGLGGKHIWPEIQRHIDELGRQALKKVDDQMKALPRWRNLNHFDHIMSVHFSDANKYEDILKMLPFTTHNVLTEKDSPLGYLMLQCLRSYLNLDMWVSMEVHTTDTIKNGQKELLQFFKLINKYVEAQKAQIEDDSNSEQISIKDFNFPKMHAHSHVFDHILDKGVTLNYSTKLFERLHGPLKTWYLLKTNFKNIASQILRADHHMFTSIFIRGQIDALCDQSKDEDEESDPCEAGTDTVGLFGNATLGSAQPSCTFQELEQSRQHDVAFTRFRLRFREFLNILLRQPDSHIKIPDNHLLSIDAKQLVTEHRFLKSHYESLVDWKAHTDYLRCSPSFFSRERYDCVIVHSTDRNFFARLLYLFTFSFEALPEAVVLPVALILPFSEISVLRHRDKVLGFHRLRARPRAESVFISIRSISRGAFIVPENSRDGDFLVVDVVDTDMFLRIKAMYSI